MPTAPLVAPMDTPFNTKTQPISYAAPAAAPAAPAASAAAPATSTAGSYHGVAITPGTDAQVAAQIAAIDGNKGFVSSNSALDAKGTGSALTAAGNAITGPTTPAATNAQGQGSSYQEYVPGKGMVTVNNGGSGAAGGATGAGGSNVDPTTQYAIDSLSQGNAAMQSVFTNMQNALQMNYNAELAQSNQQYGALFQQLADQHGSAIGMAAQNSISLNPYSTARGATTNLNFASSIDNKYQEQAQSLQAQANAAQAALQAGNYKDYVSLQGSMVSQQNQFTSSMNTILQNYNASQTQKAKDQLDLEEFNKQEGDKAVSQYTDSLSKVQLPTPEDISKMTDNELMALPAVQQGLAAGYTLAGIKTDLTSASTLQAQNASYKNAQIANETRMANAASAGSRPSASETKQNNLSSLAQQLVPGQPISSTDDTPVLDNHGFITPAAWKVVEENAPSLGLSREDLLGQFGYLFYTGADGSPSKSYGITDAEAKKYIVGSGASS